MTTRCAMIAMSLLVFLLPVRLYATPLEVMFGFMDGGGGLVYRQEVQSMQDLLHKNVVIQQRDFSCGTASLATIFNYYLGRSVDEKEIIKTLLEINKKRGTLEDVIKRRGFSLLDLKLFAEDQGFKSSGFRLDYEDLVKLGIPAIVPIIPSGFKHFVVFRGADRDRVYLADPSFGNLIESVEEFKKDWYGFTNVALVVVPKGGKKIEQPPMALTDLDKVFVGQEGIDSFRYAGSPQRPFIPGEF
jgi:predicted double-glycine peptidase